MDESKIGRNNTQHNRGHEYSHNILSEEDYIIIIWGISQEN
jgi:hypothetical protein